MTPATDDGVLAGGAAWGDRFVAELGRPRGPGWYGSEELFGAGLPAALAAVGATRGTSSVAVSGALLFEAYAQRLVAAVVAARYREGGLLEADPGLVSARLDEGRLARLAFSSPPHPVSVTAAPEQVADILLAGLEPPAAAVHRHARVGLRVLRGSMAYALASTFLHLSWPDARDRARHVDDAVALLEHLPGWAELVSVRVVASEGRDWMFTDRNACCLAFRTSVNQAREQRYCSTCPVLPAETTAELFGRASATYLRAAGRE